MWEKVSTFAASKWYTHLLTLNYPLQYAKSVSNITQAAAAMHTFVLWAIGSGMSV